MKISERKYHESAREYAKRVLRENIVTTVLAPGAQVSENELAQQMGLSRTPVREALMELAKTGVVEIMPQRGSRISLIDYDLVEEARDIREMVETGILPRVCEQATDEDIAKLKHNVRLQMLTEQPEWGENLSLMELDNAFHAMLFAIARRENSFRLLQEFSIHFDRVRELSLSVVKERKIIGDHREICDAIERKDVTHAQMVMHKHLQRGRVDAEAIIAAYPQYILPEKHR